LVEVTVMVEEAAREARSAAAAVVSTLFEPGTLVCTGVGGAGLAALLGAIGVTGGMPNEKIGCTAGEEKVALLTVAISSRSRPTC